ncbi:MAG: hypothetical protein ACREBC_30275, partial [Pyrinomonadaceae bacterium]
MVVQDATAIEKIELKYRSLAPMMDERMRRCWAATEAQAYGWGGVRAVSCATGLSPNTVGARSGCRGRWVPACAGWAAVASVAPIPTQD